MTFGTSGAAGAVDSRYQERRHWARPARWGDVEHHLRNESAHERARRMAVTRPLPAPRAAEPPLDGAYSPALAGAAEVVSLVRRLADSQGRDDLVEQLDGVRAQLTVERVTVLVVGAQGLGKSSVVNALVGAPVCPTGDTPTTVAPVAVAHAPAYGGAVVIDQAGAGRDVPRWRGVTFHEATGLAATATNPDNQWGLRLVELGVPSPLLDRGLVLVDTPPIAELWTPANLRLLRVAGRAAAIVIVTSAAQPLTAGELDLARTATALCRRVVVVVNGTNAFPAWRSVVEQDELLLEQRGVSAEVIAVAAAPYWGAGGGVPPGPDDGMQALAAHLEERVVLESEHRRITRGLGEAFWAADRLRMRLEAERSVLATAGDAAAAEPRLRQAATGAQALCRADAPWHTALDSGLVQLRRDLADDLGAELGRLRDEAATRAAAVTDPASWTEAHLWLHRRLADAVTHHHRVRKLAVRALARTVSDQFQVEWRQVVSPLSLTTDPHNLVGSAAERTTATGARSLAELPLPAAPAGPVPAATSNPARTSFERWIDAASTFLADDNADLVDRVAAELEQRCQQRGMELHRSLVEVLTTLSVLRGLEPEALLRRHERLENDLEALAALDLRVSPADRGPALGY